jgi:hypothetical protein
MSCDSITCLTASCIHRCAVDSTAKITETGLPYYVVGHKNGPTMICAQANEASRFSTMPRHLHLRGACSSKLASLYSLRFLSAANDMWDHIYWIRIIKNNCGFVKLHPKVLVGL